MLDIYEVEINGRVTTLQLSEADAKARGLTTANKAKTAPVNKTRNRTRNKAV